VILTKRPTQKKLQSAFSLAELATVIAVLVILMGSGAHLLGNTGTHARKCGTDMIVNMIGNARDTAIATRRNVVLAIAEPDDLENTDERCRLGIFKVDTWPEPFNGEIIKAVQKGRWHPLEPGLAIKGGNIDGLDNPLDAPEITLQYGSESRPRSAKVHAITFNSRGKIILPASVNPVLMRIADGNYRNGKAMLRKQGEKGVVAENKIKVGRVSSRPYLINE
jgi:hypothetical protein